MPTRQLGKTRDNTRKGFDGKIDIVFLLALDLK